MRLTRLSPSISTLLAVIFLASAPLTAQHALAELGIAKGFNAFVENNFESENTDTQGRIAAGGNISLKSYGVATGVTVDSVTPSLIAAGDISFERGRVHSGSILAGGSAAEVSDEVRSGLVDGATLTEFADLPFSFADEFALLRQVSARLALAPATGVVEYQWGGAYLTGDCDSAVQVFQLDGEQIRTAHTFSVSCVPDGATLVFNISGDDPGLTNVSLELLRPASARILWNFYQAENVVFSGVGVHGSILAPDADLDTPWAFVDGTVMAKSWSGFMELHHVPFEGDISSLLPSNAPVIVPPPLLTGYEARPYEYPVQATDEDVGDVLSHSLDSAPSGIGVNPETGVISWANPAAEYVGPVAEFNYQCYVVPAGAVGVVAEGQDNNNQGLAVLSPLFKRVKDALEVAAQYTAEAAITWDNNNECLGCHVQTQSLVGLESSISKVDVDEAAVEQLVSALLDAQIESGAIVSFDHTTTYLNVQNSLALWALNAYPEKQRTLDARVKAMALMMDRVATVMEQKYWGSDHATGWLTDNNYAVTALVVQAGAGLVADSQTGISFNEEQNTVVLSFLNAVDAFANFFLSDYQTPSNQTLTSAFRLIGLVELRPYIIDPLKVAQIETAIAYLDNYLRAAQNVDGGWPRSTGGSSSSPVTSAWVGIALDQLLPAITDHAVVSNIEYLLDAQALEGTWQDTADPYFSTLFGPTSIVMAYLPVALEFLGNPDLSVAQIRLREQGDVINVSASIANRGIASVQEGVRVKFYAGADAGGVLLGETVLPPVLSGESVTATILLENDAQIGTDLYVEVESPASIEECDIQNNQRRAAVIRHRVTDRQGLFDTQMYALNIEDVNNSPSITSPAEIVHQQGQASGQRITVSDVDIGDAATFSLTQAPDGIFIDERTGQLLIDSEVLSAGEYQITIVVTDLRGAEDEQTINFIVRENLPPAIVSLPSSVINWKDAINARVNAEDPNVGDVLRYGFVSQPQKLSINRLTGNVNAFFDQQDALPLISDNPYCAVPQEDLLVKTGAADVFVAIDESGSMDTEHGWVNGMIQSLQERLQAEGVGQQLENVYGMVGFSSSARPRNIVVNGSNLVNAEDFPSMASQLRLSGGTEDGFRAIDVIFQDYPTREDAAKNIILITDEDRDNTDSSITYETVQAQLMESGALLNAVVNAGFECGDGSAAIGVDAKGVGYVADGFGGYTTCSDATAVSGFEATITDYIDLALNNGGAAWNLNILRAGGVSAQSFTAAFVDIKVQEIIRSLPAEPASDLVISAAEMQNESIVLTLRNRGLADISEPAFIAISAGDENDSDVSSSIEVASLAGGTEQILVFDLESPLHVNEVDISITTDTLECHTGNNTSRFFVADYLVEDEGGLQDSKKVLFNILDINQPPEIVSASESTIYASESYEFTVQVEDLNNGDSFVYRLIDAPEWLAIDEQTGRISAANATLEENFYQYSIEVEDISGLKSQQPHILTVQDVSNQPPVIDAIARQSIHVGDTYSAQVVTYDPEGEDVQVVIANPPQGFDFDEISGEIAWQPSDQDLGTFAITLVAVDASGQFSTSLFVIEVLPSDTDTPIDNENSPPHITSVPDGAVVAGITFSYALIATDPDGDILSYSLIDATPAMVISSAGVFTWLPEAADIGEVFTVGIEVADGRGGSATQTLNLPVNEAANTPPRFTSTPAGSALSGIEYQYQVMAVDDDGDDFSFELLPGKPNGMQLDASGVIAWTPAESQANQVFEVAVQVVDARGARSIQTFGIAVNRPVEDNGAPLITSEPRGVVVAGSTFSYHVVATDPDDDVLHYRLIDASAAMTISNAGVFSWLPDSSAIGRTFTVAIEVADGRGGTATQVLSLPVNEPANTPPRFTSTPSNAALVGVEYRYQTAAIDDDGDSLVFELLDEIPAGVQIDSNGLVRWTPVETQNNQIFTLAMHVVDGRGGRSTQTFSIAVNLAIDANEVPRITSIPASPASVAEEYQYQVRAVDPDGDALTFSLLSAAPAGMSLDTATGLLSWTPIAGQEGEYDVVVSASDALSRVSQNYRLRVDPVRDLTNAYPVITSVPTTETVLGLTYSYQILASDPDGDSLTYSLVNGPSNAQVDENGGLSWIAQGSDSIVNLLVMVSDGQLSVTQSWSLRVWDEHPPLEVVVNVTPSQVNAGEFVTVSVDTLGGEGEAQLSLLVDGIATPLDEFGQALVQGNDFGAHSVLVTAQSGEEVRQASETFLVLDASDTTPPVVEILAPEDSVIVSAPTPIIGTVQDSNIISYALFYAPIGTDQWTRFASGTAGVSEAELGIFDPTTLINGQYSIVLQATDINGQVASDAISLAVDGDLKVGNFSFTVEDLAVPMAGIPIRVTRTYDSRRRAENLDFGHGWTIGYQDARVEESRTPGRFWALNDYRRGPFGLIVDYCVEPQGAPLVTVTLPTGDVETFELGASPRCNTYAAIRNVALEFTPTGDTQSSLEALNDTTGYYLDGHLVEDGFYQDPVDPSRYRLTTKSGYIYTLNQDFGIETIVDPNGYTITYSDEGIFHSNGKAVTFERNSQGRITDVVDPSGNRIIYARDNNNDLVSVTDRDTAQTTYTYNRAHGLLDIMDPLNRRVLRNIYDDTGRLTGQEDEDGNLKIFDHNIDDRSSLVTDRDGRSTLFNYDDRGNVLTESIIISDGSYDGDITTVYSYDVNDNQETRTIGDSTWITRHSARNDVEEACNPENQCVYYDDYNSRGQEGSITDERGNTYTMSYDSVGNLYQIDSPELIDPVTGEVQSPRAGNIINRDGLVASTTDLRGLTTTYTYFTDGPAKGQKRTESNSVSGTLTYTYDDNNNIASETRERTVNGQVISELTAYDYDARDRLVRTTYPDGSYTETEYDLAGNVDRERDRFGNWTDLDYDVYGRLVFTQYPDGSSESRTYTAEGLLDTVTDRNGRVTRNEYDDAGRLWRIHNDSDNTFTETRYNAQGWVIEEYDQHRNLTEYTYDLAGRREQVIRHIDGDTQEHSFTYYPNGELETETDALGHTTTYILNELDQRTEAQYHNGTRVQERFDFMGTRTRSIDQEARATRFDHDELGRLTGVVPEVTISDIAVPATTYTYDEVGNRLTQTDANQHTTIWTYDYFGRVLTRTLPEGQQESFAYLDGQGCAVDAGSNCANAPSPRTTVHTDFNGDTITTAYDIMGRVVSTAYSKDGNSEVMAYYPNGQVHTVTDQHGITEYVYDLRDRLAREIRPDGTQMDYRYDDVGNRTFVSVTRDGELTTATTYTYDDLNRLDTAVDQSGTTTYTYDAVGNLDTVTYPNGLVTDYDYNSLNQLTDVFTRDANGTLISHYSYGLTATGRRDTIDELNGRTTAYGYDNLYRLSSETISDAINGDYSATYTYDWVGNRTFEVVDGVSTAYTYDDNDRLTQAGGTVYAYDDNGNTLSETLDGVTKTYTWDGKNKLTSLDGGTQATAYAYNHNGIRTRKTEGGSTTLFVVDENRDYAQVLEEINEDTNEIVVQYTYGHDLIIQERDNNGAREVSYYHYDGLGSTRALSDTTGTLTDTYDYEAFGEVLNETGSTENNYKFTGEQFDNTLNQYYLRARYYDQGVGRFTQMDSWYGKECTPITLNKYLYADADPANGIDPSGYMTIGSQMSAVNVQGVLTTTARATVRVYSGKNKGKIVKLTKQVGCLIGKQFVDRKRDRVEGHHPLQKAIGGSADEQVLIDTARRTHQMLHTVQNMLFREKGLPPLNKGKVYFDNYFSKNPGTRRLAFETAIQAARRVDKFCGYKGKKSFETSVRREVKRWLKTNGGF